MCKQLSKKLFTDADELKFCQGNAIMAPWIINYYTCNDDRYALQCTQILCLSGACETQLYIIKIVVEWEINKNGFIIFPFCSSHPVFAFSALQDQRSHNLKVSFYWIYSQSRLNDIT